MAMLGIGYGALLILITGTVTMSLLIEIISTWGTRKDAGDRIWLVIGASATLLLLPIVVAPAAQLRGSARSWRRYRRSREPAMTGPEMRSSAAASPTSEKNHRTIAASSGGTPRRVGTRRQTVQDLLGGMANNGPDIGRANCIPRVAPRQERRVTNCARSEIAFLSICRQTTVTPSTSLPEQCGDVRRSRDPTNGRHRTTCRSHAHRRVGQEGHGPVGSGHPCPATRRAHG